MHIVSLDHLVLTVASISRTCEFYERVLGMRAIEFSGGRTALRFGNQKINLHERGREFVPRADVATVGSGDLCFLTDVPMDNIVAHLQRHEVEIVDGPDQRSGAVSPICSVYIRDPDGNLLEISNTIEAGGAIMSGSGGRSVERVRAALAALALDCKIVEMPDSTRTAVEAAHAIGCDVSEIVKSIAFAGGEGDRVILAIMSGANRVDESLLAAAAGEKPGKANADFVRERTGFAIGGVAPIGHTGDVDIYFDEDLKKFDVLWAAAGSPFTVMRLLPLDLERIAAGRFFRLAAS